MSTRKPKRQKGDCYDKNNVTKNKHAENTKRDVLVLPPDLLQKLGINLETIQSPQHSMKEENSGSCSKSKTSELNTERTNCIQSDEKKSSILETASLMKASVLLSPTFSLLESTTSTDAEGNTSKICNEVIKEKGTDIRKIDKQNKHFNNYDEPDSSECVISRKNDSKGNVCGDETQSNTNTTYQNMHNNIEPIKAPAVYFKEETITQPTAVIACHGKKEMLTFQNNKDLQINKSISSNIEDRSKRHIDRDIVIDFTIVKKLCKENIKDKKHDAHSVLEKHGIKLVETNQTSKASDSEQCNDNDNFTTISKGRLDNLNCSSNVENVKINTDLEEPGKPKELIEEICENITVHEHKIINIQDLPKKTNGDLYLQISSECQQTDIQNKSSSAISKADYKTKNSKEERCQAKIIGYRNNNLDESPKESEAVSDNRAKNTACMSDNLSPGSTNPLDKIEEIAFYLSQHRQNSMTKNIKTVQSAGNSKLSIQGVEKPGGNIKAIQLNRNIKTYSRRKNPKLCCVTSNFPVAFSGNNLDSDIDYKFNDIDLYYGTKGMHNFCICDDFGNFVDYDMDNGYSHIHYWERKEAKCSVETLLSIYEDINFKDEDDKNMLNIIEVSDIDKEYQREIPNLEICWSYCGNIFQKQNHECSSKNTGNNFDTECVVIEIDQIDNSVNKAKRKRVDKTSESESESENLITKKVTTYVKCGVCRNKIDKYDWDHHISKEHCFIAWMEGQELDLKDKDLVTKLNKRLWDTDKLICTFCKFEFYNVKRFLKHVRKCIEGKISLPEKASDIVKYSEIVIEVPLAHTELEQEQKVAFVNKCKKKQLRTLSNIEIKKNVELPLQVGNGEKKNLGKHERVTESAQDQVVEVFQVVTEEQQQNRQNHETHASELNLVEKGQTQEIEVPVLELIGSGANQKIEVSVPPLTKTKKNALEIVIRPEEVIEVPVIETGEENVVCGVCKTALPDSLWMKHISQQHNYIAWKDYEQPLDCEDEEDIRQYLNGMIKKVGELICKTCGLKRKFAKSYLKHIKNCQITEQPGNQVADPKPVVIKIENIDSENNGRSRKVKNYNYDSENSDDFKLADLKKSNIKKNVNDKCRKADAENFEKVEAEIVIVKCGVCKLEISNAQWIQHIFKEHDYLAWQEGQAEIDANNSQQVYDHLFCITKQTDGLTCKKCGVTRRYVKSYLKHINNCMGETDTTLNSTLGSESLLEANTVDTLILDLSDKREAKCGVCQMDIEAKQWFNHAHKYHAYLAWKEGRPPLDLTNEQEVHEYLYFVSKKFHGLICHKCGLNRKYVKVYLAHLESCDSKLIDLSTLVDGNSDSFVCAVCSEAVDPNDWNDHKMKVHYNIAWVVGDYPIDVKNVGVVEKLLKAYQKQAGVFKCRLCGLKRASAMGFYVHVIQCGKTEEEIDQYKVFCELCNSKYLCFYKSQHGIMHREQELAKERKLKQIKQEVTSDDENMTEQTPVKRRAAEKAREFIEKSEKYVYNCSQCGYGADDTEGLDQHACFKVKYRGYSDSEDSVRVESSESDDESPDSAVDSTNLSDEEPCPEPRRRRGHDSGSAAVKVPRIPFTVKCARSYLKQSADDYRKTFLTNGTLYPQWQSCNIEPVAEDHVASYWPKLKESCNVMIGKSEPVTYNLFEAKKQNEFSIFVGGCIQSISWAPPHVDDSSDAFGHFLAVACHNDVDAPRLDCGKTYEYSGLLQIWDFGDLSRIYPEFALGIAHDYGTVWAIDWCPSGARDVLPLEVDNESENTLSTLRLGLLAIACSNGSAYIFSVPYPSTVKKSDKIVYKISPVAELRLSRGKRNPCQATSISWSPQFGHGTIIVGYSSGTVALYNLECESPLLTDKENGIHIFYPYLDERPHGTCIEDVKMFPSRIGAGLMSSTSPTGSETALQRGLARIHKHLSSTSSAFAPHWPGLIVSGNEIIMNQSVNELDFWGCGRRTGGIQSCCGCLYCGHMVVFAPPVLKILTTHPVYSDLNKEPIVVLQMRPLSRKRSKQKNDELQMRLEPLTYHDAVKLYAIDFKLVKDLDKESARQVNKPKEQYPERFPLSDVPSMAFYPSHKNHRKLAIATHAGIIFIVTDEIGL